MARSIDPLVLRWAGGSLSLGYLGELRWRITTDDEIAVEPSTQAAARRALDVIFCGAATGHEVAARAPLELDLAGELETLYADPRLVNGWRLRTRDADGDVGAHDRLAPFIAERLARVADRAWANGVVPIRPPPLAPRFSFQAFVVTDDHETLCRQLEAALAERMRAHPSAVVAFESAMRELEDAGHDLWSWADEEWGHDYQTSRPGAGLRVVRCSGDDDDAHANEVSVSFRPPM